MKRLFLFLYVALALLLPKSEAFAQNTPPDTAIFKLSGPKSAVVGQTIQVLVLLSTTTNINTVQASLSYSKELLSATNIGQGSSILHYWAQEPAADQSSGVISFSGGLPNPGFAGSNGRLIYINFKTKAIGQAHIFFNSTEALLNDGKGTETPSIGDPYTLQINPTPPGQTPTPATIPADTTPPDHLELLVSHESELFNGDWFAVFQAEDSESGIDHYEIAETTESQAYPNEDEWVLASSPYRLHMQERNTNVFLKAVDKNGNRAVIHKAHKIKSISFPTPNWRVLIILSVLAVIAALLPIFVYHRKKN